MLGKDDNALDNFGFYEDEESTPKIQDIEGDYRDLVGNSSDTGSYIRDDLLGCIYQDRLLENESSLSLRKVRFSDQKFATGTFVSIIKYNHLKSHDDNLFYLFHDQLNNILAHYFVDSKITKDNVDKFWSKPLMTLLIEKICY